MDEKDYITNSLNEMLDSKDVQNMQLASNIIKNQPDMIKPDALHWYNLDDFINPKTSIKMVELYCSEGNHDKVYIVNMEKIGKNYTVIGYYSRRGKKMRSDVKYKGTERYYADDAFEDVVREKKDKKGYTQISES